MTAANGSNAVAVKMSTAPFATLNNTKKFRDSLTNNDLKENGAYRLERHCVPFHASCEWTGA
jgi:hypothetical protein